MTSVSTRPQNLDASLRAGLARFVEATEAMARKATKLDVSANLAQIEKLARVLGGIPVWEVFPDSAAAMAGVRFGDIIVAVNGTATPTFEDFLAAGEAHIAHIEFEVFRNGRLLLLTCDDAADA
jgi:S1-C subfamily serine protease